MTTPTPTHDVETAKTTNKGAVTRYQETTPGKKRTRRVKASKETASKPPLSNAKDLEQS